MAALGTAATPPAACTSHLALASTHLVFLRVGKRRHVPHAGAARVAVDVATAPPAEGGPAPAQHRVASLALLHPEPAFGAPPEPLAPRVPQKLVVFRPASARPVRRPGAPLPGVPRQPAHDAVVHRAARAPEPGPAAAAGASARPAGRLRPKLCCELAAGRGAEKRRGRVALQIPLERELLVSGPRRGTTRQAGPHLAWGQRPRALGQRAAQLLW